MAFKVFLDANVLLDYFLKRQLYIDSKQVIALSINAEIEACTSAGIIQIVAHWLTKAYGVEKTKELLLTLVKDVGVIYISEETLLWALRSNISDIEDAFQYYVAVQYGVDYFISHDKKLKKEALPVLPILTASELLKRLEE